MLGIFFLGELSLISEESNALLVPLFWVIQALGVFVLALTFIFRCPNCCHRSFFKGFPFNNGDLEKVFRGAKHGTLVCPNCNSTIVVRD
jgi:DNA-directed RNA polymerase subunit RPC12/RpoP